MVPGPVQDAADSGTHWGWLLYGGMFEMLVATQSMKLLYSKIPVGHQSFNKFYAMISMIRLLY